MVETRIKSISLYSYLPSQTALRDRFIDDLDWRYTEFYLWGAIMMRSITATLGCFATSSRTSPSSEYNHLP